MTLPRIATPDAAGRLQGERLFLRALAPADVTERYLGWLQDAEVSRFLETRHERQTLDGIEAYVRATLDRDDSWLFAICRRPDGAHIGNIKLGPIKPHHSVADVSLLIGERACWGQGYGTEAIVLATDYAFAELGLGKLSAGLYAQNVASLKAFLAAGYRQEGLRRKHYLLDGEPADIIELGCCAEDWQAAKTGAAVQAR